MEVDAVVEEEYRGGHWHRGGVQRWAIYGNGPSMAMGYLWQWAIYGNGPSMAMGHLWQWAYLTQGGIINEKLTILAGGILRRPLVW